MLDDSIIVIRISGRLIMDKAFQTLQCKSLSINVRCILCSMVMIFNQ